MLLKLKLYLLILTFYVKATDHNVSAKLYLADSSINNLLKIKLKQITLLKFSKYNKLRRQSLVNIS